jgi:RimJ/RimL family protein N-acetyltransferase
MYAWVCIATELAGWTCAMTSPTYFLKTERIGFRRWTADDMPLALDLWGNPQVTDLIADLGRPSPRQACERLAQEIANQQSIGIQYWPIFLLDSGAHLGCCGLRPYRPDERLYELGAHLRPAWWGNGYATEAAQVVLAFAFGPLGAAGLFARHHPRNNGSRRLVTRLGFRYAYDEFLPQTGLNHPSYYFLPETRSSFGGRGDGDGGRAQTIVIRAGNPALPDVQALIAQLDEYQRKLYPPESLHLSPVSELGQPDVTFLVAHLGGASVGCGALMNRHGDYGEVKRMYVRRECRGLGIGRRLLEALEARASYLGLQLVRLETGVAQPEALRLYEGAGYKPCDPFGSYAEDPLTVYMEKELAPAR